MRRLVISLMTLVLLGGLGVGGAYVYYDKLASAPGPLVEDQILAVERGSGVAAIAARLEREGIIKNAYFLKLADQLEEPRRPLKAGEFLFPARASLREVLAVLRDGESVARFITIPEGLTAAEATRLINAEPALKGGAVMPPAEGHMLPETYRFTYFDTRQQLLDRTTKAMTDVVAELWPERQPDLPITTPEEAVILASIVEKETAVAEERGRVAGVFINRLRKGMRLQSDPTVIYGITLGQGPLGRPISRADLRDKNDHNTYVIPGLPPTPIANPGRDAIAAVLNPTKTNDLYFVADGTGGHAFAETLAEHNRNVAKWRKIERERRSQ